MEVPQSKMASWTHWIRVLWVQVRTPTSVSKVEYNLGRHWCPHMWPHMHTYHIHKHRKQKPHLCYCQRAERGQEAASPQCWELNPAPHIATTEFPALILACLLAASLSSDLQCWEVVLPQWLLLGYFQIYVSIHIPALVFPGWQGDQLLGTVTFIFCTHCAVGRREWRPVKDLPLLVVTDALRLGQPAIYKVQWNAYNFSTDGQAFVFLNYETELVDCIWAGN